MRALDLDVGTLYKYIKLRFLVIGLLLMISVVVLPYWVPINAGFNPVYSINSDGNLGRSQLVQHLGGYQIEREHLADSSTLREADLIVIMSPQNQLSSEYVQNIVQAHARGTKVLMVGKMNLNVLASQFDVFIEDDASRGNRIFDPTHNGGEMYFPALEGMNLTDIYGVVPTRITSYDAGAVEIEKITTKTTAGFARCYDLDDPCLGSRTVGVIGSDFGLLADDWMFTNQYLELFPNNSNLFLDIVRKLIGKSGSIVFEESHYEWAPLNREGVENFVQIQMSLEWFLGILSIMTLIVPLFVGIQAGLFDKEGRKSKTNDVKERLSYIHVEKLPSAPLNLMENILMEEKLRFTDRGKFYFQFAADELIGLIEDYRLREDFSDKLFNQLQSLRLGLYSKESSWRVLEMAYTQILSLVAPEWR